MSWGFAIGLLFGITYYTVVEFIPTKWPDSVLAQVRTNFLANPLIIWFRIRDSWVVWPDGGLENQYQNWRIALENKPITKGPLTLVKKVH